MKRYLLLTFLVLLMAVTVTAKGTADKIILTTPDGQTINLTDPALIEPISMAALEKFPNTIAEPKVTGQGYELARAFKDGNRYRIFDRVRYYPVGEHGYVFYMGIENGSSEYDRKWFEASEAGVEAMNKIISRIKTPALLRRHSVLE